MAETGSAGRGRRFPGVLLRLLAFAAAAAVVYLFVTEWTRWDGEPGRQTTNDAFLQSDLTPISAKVPGYVRAVLVQDYDQVHAGQVIAIIVDDDYRATVAQAAANAALATAQIATLQAQRALQGANIQAAQAVVAATTANIDQNSRDVRRAVTLFSGGSGSAEEAEHAKTISAQLQAQLDQNRAQLAAAQKQIAVFDSELAQARATQSAQNAALDVARINLGYTLIRAPADGEISTRQILPGQYLGVGGLVTTVAALPHIWVLANYRETQLTYVAVDETATVRVDSFPGHTLRGHVVALAPASGAQFALLPPDNATGNFTKIVQRFTVKIAIDDADGLAARLRPGMSVTATIDARPNGVDAGTPE